MAPSTNLRLFDRQADALESKIPELLVGGGRGPCGLSHLLRVTGIVLAAENEGLQVVLAKFDAGDVRRDQVEGRNGIIAIVADMQRHGACVVTPTEIRFVGGGVLRWTGLKRETEVRHVLERRCDVLLLDDVEEVPEALYQRLQNHVTNGVGLVRRTIAVSNSLGSAGWVDLHWNGFTVPGRGFMPMSPNDIAPGLVDLPEAPSYRDFIESIQPGWIWTPHIELIVDAVDQWIKGVWEHLAIFLPSQHSKTECGPRNAIPHILKLHPTDWCAISSYGSDLANSRSADARDNFLAAGGELKEGRRRINEWMTRQGGGCWSAGTAAGQAGRSATWLFMDDGDKDWLDAINKTQQGKKHRWYGSVWRARESMFAAGQREQKQCITSTRWDPGDLAGYAMQKGHEAGESWGLVVLPALYDPKVADIYQDMYPKFTIMEDFRTEPGEPIWPDRRDEAKWTRVRVLRGPVIFLTECQQNAQGVVEGGQFWSEWFVRIARDPAYATETPNEAIYIECCRAWDLAGTAGGGDYTAGAKLGILDDGHVIVRHVVRDQLSTGGVKQLIAATMILDGPDVVIRVPIDPNSGGVAAATEIHEFLKLVAFRLGIRQPQIVLERPRRMAHATLTAKAARATDLISFAQPGDWQEGRTPQIPGGVSYIGERWGPAVSDRVGERYAELAKSWPVLTAIAERGATLGFDWQTPWLQEMESFTGEDGRHDDQVDCTVDAFDQIRYHEEPYSAVITRM